MSDLRDKDLLLQFTLRLGDDALILGHRLSEWCRNGPFLEEDIALSNIALDYIGRARMHYSYASDLSEGEKSEDDFAFLRECRDYQNFLINELPRGDFAQTMARQLILDVFYTLQLEQMSQSKDATLAAIAGKAIKETKYHLRRSTDWVLRLGDGTEESHNRLQAGFDAIWGYVPEMFEQDEVEEKLVKLGVAVNTKDLKPEWEKQIGAILKEATIDVPQQEWTVRGGRAGFHTEHLGHLLSELQYMQRSYPGLEW
ncbi:MAG: phenylacetate-CoA oxygenase subunit PaaC [Gammaproteobacteria bacterium]|nr:phenylacetate-CoA oxygenase subunit PaaC [Gammaproteobacteria bacterium]